MQSNAVSTATTPPLSSHLQQIDYDIGRKAAMKLGSNMSLSKAMAEIQREMEQENVEGGSKEEKNGGGEKDLDPTTTIS
jgi:hypothetical protein